MCYTYILRDLVVVTDDPRNVNVLPRRVMAHPPSLKLAAVCTPLYGFFLLLLSPDPQLVRNLLPRRTPTILVTFP
jgi:hypothetical protein